MMHIPVLPKEVINGLNLKKGDVFVDATLGSAGHSLAVCEKFGKDIQIIGIDQDPKRVEESGKKLEEKNCNFQAVHGNFRNISEITEKLGVGGVDKILFDLGFNSEQLENSGRGFSFQKDEPLLMNFGKTDFTAKEIVNDWSEETLRDILWGYGQEKFSRQIAKKIVELRKEKEIETTKDLVEIIEKAVPNWYKHKRIHFATKTFQALRIAVNDELEALKEALKKSFEILSTGGRMAVISFHSLEDRLTKQYFRELEKGGKGVLATKKPIAAGEEERKENPRSRSAKLRIIEKI